METLVPNQEFTRLASEEQIAKTVQALEAHGIQATVVETGDEARRQVLDLIPSGAEVYSSPSQTLELIGLAEDIEHPTRFQSMRARLHTLDRVKQQHEIRRLTVSPDVLVGSVHAITEQGQVLIASAVGSQLGSTASGAGKVIWVVGTQKLVPTLDEGFRRIQEYSLPLESARTLKVYGQASAINKLLIINGEHLSGRITIILVKQNLGF
jgi:acyl-CoA hydrolase